MKFLAALKDSKLIVNDDGEIFRYEPHYAIPMRWLERDDWRPFTGKLVKEYDSVYEIRHTKDGSLFTDNLNGVFNRVKTRVTIEEIK